MAGKAGPTGKFPQGRLSDDDKGELAVAIGAKLGQDGQPIVVLNFNTSVTWIALPPEAIDDLCEQLQKQKERALLLRMVKDAIPKC